MTVARIDFAMIKEQASFSLILQRYGIQHNGSRGQVTVCCPFHDDTRPSLSVNLDRKLFNCFSCSEKGDVLDFVAKMEKVSIGEAARIIAGACGIPIDGVRSSSYPPRKPVAAQQAGSAPQRPGNGKIARCEAQRGSKEGNRPLGYTLGLDPKHPYLAERGLTPKLIAEFGLGYSGSRFVLTGRVCIPIHSVEGQLIAYAGRWASKDVPPRVPKYLLPRGFKKSEVLFNLHRVASADHVMLVEGYWGVFRLHALGIPAVALMGRTLSKAQEELLACSQARFLTLFLDGDEAGREAAQALLPHVTRNWYAYCAELPDGEQPDTVDEGELRRLLWFM